MKATLSEIRMFCYSVRLAIPLALLALASADAAGTLAVNVDLTADPQTAFTASPGNQITLSATVTPATPTSLLPTGTGLFFSLNGSTTVPKTCAGGSNPATLVNGQATCVTSFTMEGDQQIYFQYSGDPNFAPDSASTYANLENHATNTGTTYCNSGAISADGQSNLAYFHTSPYPSVIFVGDGVNTDIPGTVSTVSVTLKNFSAPNLNGLRFAVLSPGGTHALEVVDGSTGSAVSGDYNFGDGHPELTVGAANVPGSYAPFAGNVGPFTEAPAPAPQLPTAFSIPYPAGNATFSTAFAGAPGHGAWSLFAYNASGQPATAAGGWCLNITIATGSPTTTTLSSNPTLATLGRPVTLTATVTSSNTPVSTGSVTFSENDMPLPGALSTVANVVNGVATISTSGLPEGDHAIVAQYHDPSGVNADSTGTITIRVDAATSTPIFNLTTGEWRYCNQGGITIPAGTFAINDFGPAQPNPSNIFVFNLPGTINRATVTLNQFTLAGGGHNLDSLLVGPNGSSAPTSAQTLDFFSTLDVLGGSFPLNLTIADASGALPCTGTGTVGTSAAPVSCVPTLYFSSPFYVRPPSVQHAAPFGPFTLNTGVYTATGGGVFSNTNGNGTWSLYFNQTTHGTGSGVNNGWCMNFTENPPAVSVTSGHIGPAVNNDFVQGQQGALTFSILNQGFGPTGDPDGNHPLTVIDTLPAALAFKGSSGTGWTCNALSNVVTCANHNAIPAGNSYPPLTLLVNVSPTAPGSVTNPFALAGGGTSGTTGSDTVTIDPAPVLAILKTHTGTFAQGGIGQWNITVSNTAAGSNTLGTVAVSDTLPSGFTASSVGGTGWSCNGVGTAVFGCTSTQVVPGGSAFPAIQLMANVPASSPASVSNTASASGGGDLIHINPSTAVSSTDTVSVVQTFQLFSEFQAKLVVMTGLNGSFDLTSLFALSSPTATINPVTQPVTLQIGNYLANISPGWFQRLPNGSKAGSYIYSGFIGGATLGVQINPLGSGLFQFKANATFANFTGFPSPTPFSLTIGTNGGTTLIPINQN